MLHHSRKTNNNHIINYTKTKQGRKFDKFLWLCVHKYWIRLIYTGKKEATQKQHEAMTSTTHSNQMMIEYDMIQYSMKPWHFINFNIMSNYVWHLNIKIYTDVIRGYTWSLRTLIPVHHWPEARLRFGRILPLAPLGTSLNGSLGKMDSVAASSWFYICLLERVER